MLINTLANCPYGGIMYRHLAKLGAFKFIGDKSYLELNENSYISLADAVSRSTDCILLYWRWSYDGMDNAKRAALVRQEQLLANVPSERLLVWDGDHMLTTADRGRLMHVYHVPVLEPALWPGHDSISCLFPYFAELEQPLYHDRSHAKSIYIGTPLDRAPGIAKYFQDLPTDFYGSWQPSQLVPDLHVPHGKLDNSLVLDKLRGRVSVILAKPSYYSAGYITPRWYECAYASCAVIVPDEYSHIMPRYMRDWVAHSNASAKQMYDLLVNDQAAHKANVQSLRRFCKATNGTEAWLNDFTGFGSDEYAI